MLIEGIAFSVETSFKKVAEATSPTDKAMVVLDAVVSVAAQSAAATGNAELASIASTARQVKATTTTVVATGKEVVSAAKAGGSGAGALVAGASAALGEDSSFTFKVQLLLKCANGDTEALPQLATELNLHVDPVYVEKLAKLMSLVQGFAKNKRLSTDMAKAAFVDAFIDHVFHEFDTEGVGRISYGSFVVVLRRLRLTLPDADMKVLFQTADADKSGYVDKREFRAVLEDIMSRFVHQTLAVLHLDKENINKALVALFAFLLVLLGFLLVGVIAFADATEFTALITGALPAMSRGIQSVFSPANMNRLLTTADDALQGAFDALHRVSL